MKVAVIFSGGKDSTYALYQVLKQGHEVKYLITMKPEKKDSWMFHHPVVDLTQLQAASLGIKQIVKHTKGDKEKELENLKSAIASVKDEIESVVSGALASNYQKSRIDKICKELGLESIAPLWQVEPEKHWENLLHDGFKVMITAVASDGLDMSWLGKIIDEKNFRQLKELSEHYGMNLGFEGGEAETFVLDCPIFEKKIDVLGIKPIWDEKTSSGYLDVTHAKLVEKS